MQAETSEAAESVAQAAEGLVQLCSLLPAGAAVFGDAAVAGEPKRRAAEVEAGEAGAPRRDGCRAPRACGLCCGRAVCCLCAVHGALPQDATLTMAHPHSPHRLTLAPPLLLAAQAVTRGCTAAPTCWGRPPSSPWWMRRGWSACRGCR